jgi:hypothetical protein
VTLRAWIFSLPWYKIGIYGNRAAEEQDAIFTEKEAAIRHESGIVHQVEVVETVETSKVSL